MDKLEQEHFHEHEHTHDHDHAHPHEHDHADGHKHPHHHENTKYVQDHLDHCVVDAVQSGDTQTLDDFKKAIDRYIR